MNPYEGTSKRVLFVCSAGLLRSPTAAEIGIKEFGWNCRAVGAFPKYALTPVNAGLLHWADEIFCMATEHENQIKKSFRGMIHLFEHKIRVLEIEDNYAFRDPELIKQITDKLRGWYE
jgi:predicted protein tyrosine phosphatase